MIPILLSLITLTPLTEPLILTTGEDKRLSEWS